MSQAIMSFLGGWWARWLVRASGKHAFSVTKAPQESGSAASKDAASPAVAIHGAKPDADCYEEAAVEQSFLETVKMDQVSDFTKTPFSMDPRVRQSTLTALGKLRQIPALQSLVQGVVKIMARDGVTVDEIVESLEKDSALCVRVLAMANSVTVSPEQRIEDLQTAVQMLGMASVRRVAQAVFTLRGAQGMVDGLDWRHLWIHALATAAIAEELDRRISPTPSTQIYMAGLMHDLGKIVLSTVAVDAYRDVIVASWNGQGRLEKLEHDRLGVDHREAGVIFAKANGLSDVVIDAIAHHGAPEGAEHHRREVALVSIANFMCKARGLGFSGSRLDPSDGDLESLPAWKVLGSECGRETDVPALEREMTDFLAVLRVEMRGLRA
jgi:putative nucleotidyltransferase with HDIG domain